MPCRQLNKLVGCFEHIKKAEPMMGSAWFLLSSKLITVRSELQVVRIELSSF